MSLLITCFFLLILTTAVHLSARFSGLHRLPLHHAACLVANVRAFLALLSHHRLLDAEPSSSVNGKGKGKGNEKGVYLGRREDHVR
jgi:hypothetical protein